MRKFDLENIILIFFVRKNRQFTKKYSEIKINKVTIILAAKIRMRWDLVDWMLNPHLFMNFKAYN
jgi:hypothetical protein